MKLLVAACCAAALVHPAAAADVPVPPGAVKVLGLFDRLRAACGQHVAFQLSETEVNEYVKYALQTAPRQGFDSVTLKFFTGNYISSLGVIDFDAVEQWKPGTIPKLLRPALSGKKSLWIDCRFQVNHGQITFTIEKAYYQDLRLPAFAVQKMIEVVAARQPEKYDTTKPIPLGFGVRNLWTGDHYLAGEN